MGIRSFLFGAGKVRVEATDSKGRNVTIKVPYEGAPNADEIIKHIKAMYAVEYGATIVSCKITAWVHR